MESAFVVIYNHKIGKFSIDMETTGAHFPDGNVFDGMTWVEFDSNEEIEQDDEAGLDKLALILTRYNNS